MTHLIWEEKKFELLRIYLFKIPKSKIIKKSTFRSESFVCVFKSLQVYYTCILVYRQAGRQYKMIDNYQNKNRYKEQHLQKLISSTSKSTLQSSGEHLYKMYKNCNPTLFLPKLSPLIFKFRQKKQQHFIQEIFYNWEPRADLLRPLLPVRFLQNFPFQGCRLRPPCF